MQDRYEVVVVGGGTTGAAACYHLSQAGIKNILCLEMGRSGEGQTQTKHVDDQAPLTGSDEKQFVPKADANG